MCARGGNCILVLTGGRTDRANRPEFVKKKDQWPPIDRLLFGRSISIGADSVIVSISDKRAPNLTDAINTTRSSGDITPSTLAKLRGSRIYGLHGTRAHRTGNVSAPGAQTVLVGALRYRLNR